MGTNGTWGSFVGQDNNNQVYNNYGVATGGQNNTAGIPNNNPANAFAQQQYATVSGGFQNTASGGYSTVGGGLSNTANGAGTTVAGGSGNTASGSNTIVGGGQTNTASNLCATVGGGVSNTASNVNAVVAGGDGNTASGDYSMVGGGSQNTANGVGTTVAGGLQNTASGNFGTVPGGYSNIASGEYSFAAGNRAMTQSAVSPHRPLSLPTIYNGAFVWADSSNFDFNSAASNEFAVRATGGVRFVTAINTTTGAPTTGVQLAAGSGSWSILSDRNLKENFESLNGFDVLERLSQIPISEWNYKAQGAAIRHVGPIAQDFYEAFRLGEDDRHISTVDVDGIALVSIQTLYSIVKAKTQKIDQLERRLEALERSIKPTPIPATS